LGLRAVDEDAHVEFPTKEFWFAELFCSAEVVSGVPEVQQQEHEDADFVMGSTPEADAEATANDQPPAEEPARLRIHVVVDGFSQKPNAGSRCRDMLICQPPLHSISAFTSCCAGPRFWRHRVGDERPPAEVVRSEKGITVGDILDATKRLKESHQLCPDASPFDHNASGFVNVQVSFEAEMACLRTDPMFVRERLRMLEDRVKHRERVTRQRRIDAYSVAKRVARDEGRAIPTLEEFEAAAVAAAATVSTQQHDE
jgi:hypothetical protein